MMKLHAFVKYGSNQGVLLFPHRHKDGNFVVSMTRFKKDYKLVSHEDHLIAWLEKGYRLRMSNSDRGIRAPSLIAPQNIYRPVCLA